MKHNLYLAGPLFSDAEREFNKKLKITLTPFFDVYLPQEDGGLMVEMIKDGMTPYAASKAVFSMDIHAMENSNLLLIILDGRAVDEGAAFELGFAFSHEIPCFGLRTDPRQLLETGHNPMIESALNKIFYSVSDLVDWAKSYAHNTSTIRQPNTPTVSNHYPE